MQRKKHLLVAYHRHLGVTLEVNGAGWGAVLVTSPSGCLSVYLDGSVSPMARTSPEEIDSALRVETLEGGFAFLNLMLERRGGELEIRHSLSGRGIRLTQYDGEVTILNRTAPRVEAHRWKAVGDGHEFKLSTEIKLEPPVADREKTATPSRQLLDRLAGQKVRLQADGLDSPELREVFRELESLAEPTDTQLEALLARTERAANQRRQVAQCLSSIRSWLERVESRSPDEGAIVRLRLSDLENRFSSGEALVLDEFDDLEERLLALQKSPLSSDAPASRENILEVESSLRGPIILKLPFELKEKERILLVHLLRYERGSISDLRSVVGKRALGLAAQLCERLRQHGLEFMGEDTEATEPSYSIDYEAIP